MSNIPIGSDVSWAPWNEPAREEPCCPRCKSESVFMAGRIVRRMNAQGVYEIVKKEIIGIY